MSHNIRNDELAMRYLSKPVRMLFSLSKQKELEKQFTTDESGRIKVPYKGADLIFDKTSSKYELFEQFIAEQYKRLDVKGKTVVDIGAGTGDTAIYFMLNGAAKVYAFEPLKARFDAAVENIEANGIKNVKLIDSAVSSLDEIEKIVGAEGNVVLKIDCEGCEHDIFRSLKPDVIAKFEQVMLEFHDGYLDLKKALEGNGFVVEYGFSEYYTADFNGMLYARRK